jgi:hypothetical protein
MPSEPRDPRLSGPLFLSAPARRWPVLVLILHVLLGVGAAVYLGLARRSGLEELLPGETRSDLRVLRQEFPYPDDLLLFVRGGRPSTRELFLEDLEQQLAQQPGYYPERLYKIDVHSIGERLLYYLSVRQLQDLAQLMHQLEPRLRSGGSLLDWAQPQASGKPNGLQAFYMDQLQISLTSRGRAAWKNPLDHLVQPAQAALLRPFWEGNYQRYLQLKDGSHLMLIRPSSDQAVSEMRARLHEVAGRNPEVDVELTGNQAILWEQRQALMRQMGPGTAFISIFLGLAMVGGLLPPQTFGVAMLATLLGLLTSCGAGAWWLGLGPIWLTAQAMVATVAGYLGLHYAVDRDLRHVFRVQCVAVAGFVALGMLPLGPPSSLGWACASGMVLCGLALLTLVPALDQLGWIPPDPGVVHWLERSWPGRRPTRAILALTASLALVSLAMAEKSRFSADPLAALDVNAPSLRTERQLHQRGSSALFALVMAPNLQRANAYCQTIRSLPRVQETFSLAQFLPPNPDPQRSLSVRAIARVARSARLPKPIPLETADDLMALARAVPAGQHSPDRIQELGPGGIQDALKSFQSHLLQDLDCLLRLLASQTTEAINLKALPSGVQQRLVGQSGSVAVMVFPKLGPGHSLERFVADIRGVTSVVGGPAVLAADLATLTRKTLKVVPWALSAGMIAGLALVLGSPWRTALVVLGPCLAVLFCQASLALYRVPLNFLTWPAPSLVLLLGVSISLSTLRRPRASLKALFPAVTLLAVALFMLGSTHPGLAGLGLVMALGLGFNLLVAVVVLPSAQAFFRAIQGRPR